MCCYLASMLDASECEDLYGRSGENSDECMMIKIEI